MLILNNKKLTPTKKTSLRPGRYPSVAKEVIWSPGYEEGTAFTIRYQLTLPSGAKVEYEELFFNSTKNKRTDAFDSYLKKNGIKDLVDFVGCQEEVVITMKNDGYKAFPSITDRTFIGTGKEETSS